MREVAAVAKIHTHDGVARFQKRKEDGGVGLRTGVRLHVGIIGAKQRLGALNRQLLNNINIFAAAIIALARITFSVLVGQAGALCFHDARTGVVFGSDQFDVGFLTLRLVADGGGQFIIKARDGHIFTKHGDKLR